MLVITKSHAMEIWKSYHFDMEVFGIDDQKHEALIENESDFENFGMFGIEASILSDKDSHDIENELDGVITILEEDEFNKDDLVQKLREIRDLVPCSCGKEDES